MRKIISIICTVAMVLTLFTFSPMTANASLADCRYPSHWYGKFSMSSELLANGTHISSTNERAYSGNRSLKMSLGSTSTNGDTYSVLTDLGETLDASKTYTFEFYAYGSRIGGSPVKQNDSSIGWNHIWSNTTRTDMGNGWTKYEYTFTGQAASAIGIREWDNRDYYIDDVRLYETSTGTEVTIVNGDFEDYIDFYEAPTGITNGNWDYWLRDTGGEVDDYVRYEDIGGGNYAMHIRYNNDVAANVYVQISNKYNNGQLVNGTSYTVEYDIKGSARDKDALIFFPLRLWNYSNSFSFGNAQTPDATTTVTALPNGFKHVVKTFTSATSGDAVFGILAQSACDMIIDNIELYATDDTTKTNLIVDGDFSQSIEATAAPVPTATPVPTPTPTPVPTAPVDYQRPSHWSGAFSDSTAAAYANYFASTDSDAHSGSRSAYFKIIKKQGTYSFVNDLLETTDSSKSYRFEFWAKGADGTDKRFKASIADGTNKNKGSFASDVVWDLYETSELGSNNWRKYSYDFTGKAITSIGLQLSDECELLFDDFKLYELSGGEFERELTIANGDMEDYLDFNGIPEMSTYNENWQQQTKTINGTHSDFFRFEDIGGGDYALHVKYIRNTEPDTYAIIRNYYSGGQIESGKAYTVEYDIKQSTRGEQTTLHFFPLRVWNYSQCFDIETATKPGGVTKSVTLLANGFKHVVKEYTSTTSGDAVFGFLIQSQGEALIDNIKVYASDDNSKTNLIIDGDFSGTAKSYDTPDFSLNNWKAENDGLIFDFDIDNDISFNTSILVGEYDNDGILTDVRKFDKALSNSDNTASFNIDYDTSKTVKAFFWQDMMPLTKPVDLNSKIIAHNLCDNVILHLPAVQTYLEAPYEDMEGLIKGGSDIKPVRLYWSYLNDGECTFETEISENENMTNAKTIPSNENSCFVYNLKVGTKYYWRVTVNYNNGQTFTSDISEFTTQDLAPRQILANGVENMRDLGGWHTLDGKRVKQGMMYRNIGLDYEGGLNVTPKGIDIMVNELGIKTEIDLRNEIIDEASVLGNTVTYYSCPMSYSSDVVSNNKESIKRVFEIFADESNYPIDFHCVAGADRTGCIAYLLNGLLGVRKEDLLRDYLMTSFMDTRTISGIANRYVKTLDEYNNGEGTLSQRIYAYLRDEIGVSLTDLDNIISIMTEE